jgi:hypothetical protein
MAAADGSPQGANECTIRNAGVLQARCRGQAFECMVGDCRIRQFGESPADHFEGQFEGQNGASGRQCELAAASVS